MNVPDAINQLVNEGYSQEQAIQMVADAVSMMEPATKNTPLRRGASDKEVSAYWAQLRRQAEQEVWIPPAIREAHEAEAKAPDAFETFKQNMRARNPASASPLRNTRAAIEWFKQQRNGE